MCFPCVAVLPQPVWAAGGLLCLCMLGAQADCIDDPGYEVFLFCGGNAACPTIWAFCRGYYECRDNNARVTRSPGSCEGKLTRTWRLSPSLHLC